jgi:hypothetical protein
MAIFNSFLYVYQRVVFQPSQESRSMIQDPLSCRFIIPCWNLQRCWYSPKKCQTMGYYHINMGYTVYSINIYIWVYIYMVPPCFDDPRILETKTRPIDFNRRLVIWILCLQCTLRQVSMGCFLTESLHRKPWILPAIWHNITFYVHI